MASISGLKIGFIGAGNMAQALAKGFIKAGITKSENILASSPIQDKLILQKMSDNLGCRTTHNNTEVSYTSDILIIAVKPNIVPNVLSDISKDLKKNPLVTSLAIGVPINYMEQKLPKGSRVIRILPNTPALVNLGASVFSRGQYATAEDSQLMNNLLESVGECEEVPEVFLNAVSGLSGAGPAYMFLILEALADGGVKMGLPRNLALKLAAQTMMGSASLLLNTDKSPGQLKDEVCSPGGCSIAGISALENGGLRAALINAVTEATEKSEKLQNMKAN